MNREKGGREENQCIECLLCARNNILLNLQENAEKRMLCYYHSYFLDEETSTGKLNICPGASMHPFESRALLIFLCLRAFALAIASTWIALSQESHVAPSLPSFRPSLTLSYDTVLCFFTVLITINIFCLFCVRLPWPKYKLFEDRGFVRSTVAPSAPRTVLGTGQMLDFISGEQTDHIQ